MSSDPNVDVPICFLLRKMSKVLGEFHKAGLSKELVGFKREKIDELFINFSRLQELVDNMSDGISETNTIKVDLKDYGIDKKSVDIIKEDLYDAIEEDRMC